MNLPPVQRWKHDSGRTWADCSTCQSHSVRASVQEHRKPRVILLEQELANLKMEDIPGCHFLRSGSPHLTTASTGSDTCARWAAGGGYCQCQRLIPGPQLHCPRCQCDDELVHKLVTLQCSFSAPSCNRQASKRMMRSQHFSRSQKGGHTEE